jgi:Fur family transcriptional regulator, iron response regulator
VTAATRTYSSVLERLNAVGLRPTRQRLALAKLLLERGPRHVTAEDLFHESRTSGIAISLATVYNTLHQFTRAGLLREVVVDMGQSYFDTNTSHHHHFFDERTGTLTDIADEEIEISRLPEPPDGREIERVEVIVRLRETPQHRGGD